MILLITKYFLMPHWQKIVIMIFFYVFLLNLYYLDFNNIQFVECMQTGFPVQSTQELQSIYNNIEAGNHFIIDKNYKQDPFNIMYAYSKKLKNILNNPDNNTPEGREIMVFQHFIYKQMLTVQENIDLHNQILTLHNQIPENAPLLDGVEQRGEHQNEHEPHRKWYTLICVCCEQVYPCIQNTPILFAVSIILLASVGINIVQFSFC